MKYSPIVVAWLVIACVVGCDQSHPDDDRAQAKLLERQLDYSTNDRRIADYVSWLKRRGVVLEYLEGADGYGIWRVIQPKTSDEYDVTFHIRSFPSWASELQMRGALDINLAYMLNAPTHLAMSYAVISGTHSDAKVPQSENDLPKVDGVPVTKLVEQLFNEYKAD